MKTIAATASVGIVDLCGFTDFTRRVGDRQALDVALALYDWVEGCLDEGTSVVKHLGDGMLLSSLSPGAVEASIDRAVRSWAGPLALRGATRRGSVLLHNGDIFGDVVNTVAHDLASP